MQRFRTSIAKAPIVGAFIFKFRLPSGWVLAALLIAMLTLVPVAVVLSS